jgi:hypothetical protein
MIITKELFSPEPTKAFLEVYNVMQCCSAAVLQCAICEEIPSQCLQLTVLSCHHNYHQHIFEEGKTEI